MKKETIRTKLSKYLHTPSDTIVLEVLEGEPRTPKGGVWIEAQVEDIEKLTEDPNFDPEISGWKKYLDKWFNEGLITKKEKDTGKS